MMKELWNSIENMESNNVKQMINEIKGKDKVITLEERFKLYFGLLSINYLDNALVQMQLIYEDIKNQGISKEFADKYSDFKIKLMSDWRVWKDDFGNIHVAPYNPDEDCELIWCCCGKPICGYGAILFTIGVCCGIDAMEFVGNCTSDCFECCCTCGESGKDDCFCCY